MPKYIDGKKSIESFCCERALLKAMNEFIVRRDRQQRRDKTSVQLDDTVADKAPNPVQSLIKKERMTTMNIDNETITLDKRLADVLLRMPADDLQIAKMYLHGFTLEQIGDYFGMTKQAILKRLRKYATK